MSMPLAIWHLCALTLTLTCLVWSLRVLSKRKLLQADAGAPSKTATSASKAKQPYDAFLLLDVEATCQQGTNFNYPNEIIEFPVCLMCWKDRRGGEASQLEVIDEFRSFVKPTWRPILSHFCTELTGITQDQVDAAPGFPDVLRSFRAFLTKHKLIEKSGKRRIRFCWCSDGPFDIRDFIVKQCFISNIPIPEWLTGDVLDVRRLVMTYKPGTKPQLGQRGLSSGLFGTLNIPSQLSALGLSPFQGRQHSGIDDTRNLARIVTELALKGVRLQPNTSINPRRRWFWMGKPGEILEDHVPH
ncbi:ribonuclease H-like domain-containing protein [Mycena sp. CBHHK59/15]|nr:ribonuclease H-like domain-containing protein [Mycena sp. CBHHK59/15]